MLLKKLRDKMQTEQLDAFLVTEAKNRHYISGFTGSTAILIITQNKQLVLTDSRYYERIELEAPDWELAKVVPKQKPIEKLKELIPHLNLEGCKIGFEADHITVSDFKLWQEELASITLIDTTNFVTDLRIVKTEKELKAIRKAVSLADKAMDYAYKTIKPGMTEKELAWNLETFMRTRGASALSFDIIAAAGPNSAMPHALSGDYKIKQGDVVLIDMGCIVDGYCSDLTRTFSLGEPTQANFRLVWQTVSQALETASKGLKAGITGVDADALARNVIAKAGYGDKFGHSLGHGVGLNIHESPGVSYSNEDPLIAGSVITLEPGIYLPGHFGVRLEDMVVITKNGLEILTSVPKIDVLTH